VRARPHMSPDTLVGRTIDAHAHVGISVKGYACLEFPYCQSLEGLAYRQAANDVDASVVFPLGPDLFFDLHELVQRGVAVPAEEPLSAVPYGRANEMVLNEVYLYCPELRDRFLPFVCVDPGREVAGQIELLRRLEQQFPIYGIKVSPVLCQSPITSLLEAGAAFTDFARARDLPFLFHTTLDPREGYSHADSAFEVIEANPDLRVCLAHCIGFGQSHLERADDMDNVWVDTAAMKIQVQLAAEGSPLMASDGERVPADYDDHRDVMRCLVERFPDTFIWGSDSPAYAYICRRQQGEGVVEEFRLKATYEDEVAALLSLNTSAQRRAANTNTIRWLFGNS
jgi:hypothetical protein